MIDKAGEHVVRHDMQRWYGISLDDIWRGTVPLGHAATLAQTLYLIPGAAVRETVAPGQAGWSTDTYVMADLYDLIHSLILGLSNKRMTDNRRYPRPTPTVQPKKATTTIADFNLDRFMAQINT